MKYTYSTVTNKKGTFRLRHWNEDFKDEDTGEVVTIKRSQPIKFNGQKLRWYSNTEIKRMTKKQRDNLLL